MRPVSNDIDFLNAEKKSVCDRFEMTDQEEVHYILGMSIKRDRKNRTMYISQQNYVEGILKRFGMEDRKPISMPMENSAKFHNLSDKDEPFDTQNYQQAIGYLTYLSTATPPDISVAVSTLSRYMSCPSKAHWTGVKQIICYLKRAIDFGLKFSCVNDENPQVIGYSDADWAGDLNTRRSTLAYVFQIRQSTVSWCSKRQATVAKLTTEAEYLYVALSQAT